MPEALKNVFAAPDAIRGLVRWALRKGQIRGAVGRSKNRLLEVREALGEGRKIKAEEITEFRRRAPEKAKRLARQVALLDRALRAIDSAVDALEEYASFATTPAK